MFRLSRKKYVRLVAAFVVATAILVQQVHGASAHGGSGGQPPAPDAASDVVWPAPSNSSETDTNVDADTGLPSQSSCVGRAAFKRIDKLVNYVPVRNFAGNVDPGSFIQVEFSLRDECRKVPVSLTTYEVTDDSESYARSGFQEGSFNYSGGPNEGALGAAVPDCKFIVSLQTARSTTSYKSSTQASQSTVEVSRGGQACATAPDSLQSGGDQTGSQQADSQASSANQSAGQSSGQASAPASTPESSGAGSGSDPVATDANENTTANTDPVCPADIKQRISNYSVDVKRADGATDAGLTTLLGNVSAKSRITVHFDVAQGCKDRFTLASYEAKSTYVDDEALKKQKYSDDDTGLFGPGRHELTVSAKECSQIDFVQGKVIKNFGKTETSYYRDRLIDSGIGGNCGEAPAEVLDSSQTNDSPPAAENVSIEENQVQAAPSQLAMTGIDLIPMLMVGMLLSMIGVTFVGGAAVWRRNSYWYVP